MKILFAGPSLSGSAAPAAQRMLARRGGDLRLFGPARQGDIAWAVLAGATAIGLVDGLFEQVAAVWHKDILFALSEGVQVLGGASMGALRAAECHPFGMIGVGEIFRRYAGGELEDDDAVAQLHAPAELGYRPITEALVNVEATFAALGGAGAITAEENHRLLDVARGAFFKERTYPEIIRRAALSPAERAAEVAGMVESHRVDQKARDTLALVDALLALPSARRAAPAGWTFQATRTWLRCHTAVGEPAEHA